MSTRAEDPARSNPGPVTEGHPEADEVVIGMIRFRLDRPRAPRPAELEEEDLLWRRLRRRLAEPGAIGVAPERFAAWGQPLGGPADEAPETPSSRPRKRA